MDTLKQIYKQICFDWKYSGRDMQHEFMEACYKGDMKTVIKILKYSFLELNFINDGFSWACNNGHLEVVKYLLTSPDLKEHADIHADNDKGFRGACDKGHLEVVKYLLTSPYLKEYADIHAQDDYGFRWACSNRHLEVVKYLLTTPELKEHVNIHANDDWGFRYACNNGHLEVVKYLLTSPDLKEHADIHAYSDLGFRWACEEGHLEIVKFLIFVMNFQLSLETRKSINSLDNKDDIFNLFDKRDLQRKLQESLKVNEEKPVKRTKI